MKKQILSVFFTLFVCCFNQLTWAEDVVHDLWVNGAINSEYFYTTATVADCNYTIGDVTYTKYIKFEGTAKTISGVEKTDRIVQYDARTTETQVEFVVLNSSTGNKRNFYYTVIENGETTCLPETLEIAKGGAHFISPTRTSVSTKNRSIYFSVDNVTDVHLLAVKITEKGTPIPMAGEAGYSINFANARLLARDVPGMLDGMTYFVSNDYGYKILTDDETYIKLKAVDRYIKFYAPQTVKLAITIDSEKQSEGEGNNEYCFYVAQSLSATTNETNAKKGVTYEYTLSGNSEWYIYPKKKDKTIYIASIAFSALDVVVDPPTSYSIFNDGEITFDQLQDCSYKFQMLVGDNVAIEQTDITSGTKIARPFLTGGEYTTKLYAIKQGTPSEAATATWELSDNSITKEELPNSQYCDFVFGDNNKRAAMDWTTDEYGNINIEIKDVDGTNTTWRAEAFKGIGYFKVGNAPASCFFDENYTQGSTCYQLKKKAGATLGWGETISFFGTVQWKFIDGEQHEQGPYLSNQSYSYTYGAGCASLAKPVITSVTEDKVITFEPVENAQTYEATVMFGSTVVLKQNVVSGDVLNFLPYVDGDYSVTLIAMAEGMSNSEVSNPKVISLTAAPFTPATSEICMYQMVNAEAQDEAHNVAFLSANTNELGNIVFTIKGDAGCVFRTDKPLDPAKMMIGATPATTFFTTSVDGATYTLTPKAGSGIGYGAVIQYTGSVAWSTDGWPNSYVLNKNLTFTYGNKNCTDEAPELEAVAEALNSTSVRITMTATDDHNLPITYTIQREGEEDIILNGESGVQVYYDFTDLTTNTTYYYTVFATDGFNPTKPQQLSATPAGDAEAPTNVQLILKPLSLTDAKLTVSADDNYPGDLTYTITGGTLTESLVLQGAPSTPVVQMLTGLTAEETYTYSVIVTDAAGNHSVPVEATLTMYSENILLNKPATAGSTETGNDAPRAVDDNVATFWGNYNKTTYAAHDNWLAVNCNGIYDVSSVTITWSHFPEKAGFVLQKRLGAEEWQTIYTYTGDKYNDGETQLIEFAEPIRMSDIRIINEDAAANKTYYMAIDEIAAFGEKVEDTEAPQNLSLSGEAISEESIRLTMYATDNSFGYLTYTVYVDNVAQTTTMSAPQATDVIYVIEGLTPGQTYEIYFQVKDASDNMSTSETISITTMDVAGNVAYRRLAVAGSAQDTHRAAFAVDGDNGTYWGNYGKTSETEPNNWLEVDLCGSYVVDRVSITWQHCPNDGFMLQARNGEEEWQTILNYSGTAYQDNQTQIIDLEQPTYSAFRVKKDNTAYMAIREFKVFGEGYVQIKDNANNDAHIAALNEQTLDVELDRTFIRDGYNYTLCLPFDMTAEQCLETFGEGYKLWEMGEAYRKSADMIYLPFSEVTSIEAGKPYIFCPAVDGADIENPIIAGVTINAAAPVAQGNNFATMTGIYSPTIVDASNYVLGSDNWLYQSAGDAMKGLRCYFTFGSSAPAGVRARAVFHNSDVTTDLEPIHRFTDSPIKVIENGRFVIIRNNARYNAVGEPVNR